MIKRLSDFCGINMGQSPDSTTYNTESNGLPFYQGNADFGEIHPTAKVWCSAPTKIAKKNDILISVRAPIGALNIANEKCCIGRGLAALTVDETQCKQKYLWYAIEGKVPELISKGTGSTFKAIGKSVLQETEVKLPPLDVQEDIITVLDWITLVIDAQKEQFSKLDELVKSRFIELFGEPVSNPLAWPTKPLLEMGCCKNGMNFHTGDTGVEIHCLGVGDFKDYSVINGTETLPTISLNEEPPTDYLLQDGDIVFVRSNGNKALVGRCLVVYPHNVPTTYSGFCIRYRMTSNELTIPYLLRVLKTDSMRKQMAGRGANIQNLNQQILAALNIPVPPLNLQNEFSAFVEQTDKLKFEVKQSLDKLETLKKSLMQEYFG